MLNSGQLDMLVGGLSVTPHRALQVAFTHAYIHQTVGLLVHDYRREEFNSLEKIHGMKPLRIAVPGSPYYIDTLKTEVPNAEIQVIESPRNFLTNPEADALAFTLEAGSAWTLIYPEFTVLKPRGTEIRAPGALALPQVETEFVAYVNTWLDLKEANGQINRLQRYWLSGEDMKGRVPRWSIMHNVLGLGETEHSSAADTQ